MTVPIAFDAHWRAKGELAEAVQRLQTHVLALEARHTPRVRQRRQADAAKFRAGVGGILCNVAAVELVAPGRAFTTPRDAAWNRGELGRGFAPLLDLMAASGFLTHTRSAWNDATFRHDVSQSVAGLALLDYLPPALSAEHLQRAGGPTLELRSRKNSVGQFRTLRLPATDETRRLAAEMDAVNARLARAEISRTDGRALWLHEPEAMLPRIASTRAVHLRRVFNDGTLSHGGRLFGGHWQAMSGQDRARLLRIDGERICELDYIAMVPRLCYALRGVPWPFGDDRDAPYIASPCASREAWKRWTNGALFSKGLPRAWLGKTPDARRQFAAQFAGIGWGEARTQVLKHHASLAEAGGFGCELGMEAMRAESDIAVDVVRRLAAEGVTALPVHDSFAVPASKAGVARVVMGKAALARVGVALGVAVKE